MRRHAAFGALGLAAAVIIIGLLPLALLSAVQGATSGSSVAIPLILDFSVPLRFLVVAPLLIAGTARLDTMTALALRHVAQSQLIGSEDRSTLAAIGPQVAAAQRSWLPSATILAVIVTCVTFLRIDVVEPFTSWQFRPVPGGVVRSWAGWWYLLASLPVFQFVILTWLWRYLLWCWLLWRISGRELHLIPTHPDGAGGLGYLGLLQRRLWIVVLALEVFPASLIAQEIIFLGTKLADYEVLIASLVAFGVIIILAPLSLFSTKLAQARSEGALEYAALAMEYMRAFDHKWLRSPRAEDESLIGTADIQSLADMGNSFQLTRGMRIVPYNIRSLSALMICAAAVPYLPLSLFVLPLREILKALVGIFF